MGFKLQTSTIQALFTQDKKENDFTVYVLSQKGGPIISSTSHEEAKEDFETALQLSCAVRNFLYWKGAIRAHSPHIRMDMLEAFKERVGEVEYTNRVV